MESQNGEGTSPRRQTQLVTTSNHHTPLKSEEPAYELLTMWTLQAREARMGQDHVAPFFCSHHECFRAVDPIFGNAAPSIAHHIVSRLAGPT